MGGTKGKGQKERDKRKGTKGKGQKRREAQGGKGLHGGSVLTENLLGTCLFTLQEKFM